MNACLRKLEEIQRDLLAIVDDPDFDAAGRRSSRKSLDRLEKCFAVFARSITLEEAFMVDCGFQESDRNDHVADHSRLLWMFSRVRGDSVEHRHTVANEVFHTAGSEIRKHVREFDRSIRDALAVRLGELPGAMARPRQ